MTTDTTPTAPTANQHADAARDAFTALLDADPTAALNLLTELAAPTALAWSVDTESSASTQHYIDTGRHLTVSGEDPADGAAALTTLATLAFAAAIDADPRQAFDAYENLFPLVSGAAYPRLIVDRDATGTAQFLDPDTAQPTTVIVDQRACRWNNETPTYRADGYIAVTYDGLGEFHPFVYRSSASAKPVRLPEGWSEG